VLAASLVHGGFLERRDVEVLLAELSSRVALGFGVEYAGGPLAADTESLVTIDRHDVCLRSLISVGWPAWPSRVA
jgi:hypothetical protein